MIICCDFDGTIVEKTRPLQLRPNAAETLRALVAAGHDLILHSVRGSGPLGWVLGLPKHDFYLDPDGALLAARGEAEMFDEMREFLRAERLWTLEEGGVFRLVWTLPGKPYGDVYLDDKAETMGSRSDWLRVRRTYGQ